MIVLHIAQSAGGVEKYIKMLTSSMIRDEATSERFRHVLLCSLEYDISTMIDMGIEVYTIDFRREINLMADLSTLKKIRRLIRKIHPDIVYLHSSKAGAVGRMACIGTSGYSVIYNPHGWAFNMDVSRFKRFIYTKIEQLFSFKTDKIVAISEFEKTSALEAHVCKPTKIQVIYNGIEPYETGGDSEVALSIKNELKIPLDAYIIGMVGRISQQKAPDIFLRVAKEILKKIPEAYFIIVGDGDEKQMILALAQQLGISDRLIITGWVQNAASYIEIFNQAFLLSRWEGFGLALVEYMRARRPIVATRVDAIPELIQHGETGLLVEKNDILAATAASYTLYNDENLANTLVEKAYARFLNDYTIDRVVEAHVMLFDSLSN